MNLVMWCFDTGGLDNFCDGDWMENPCTLSFTEQNKFIDVVKKTLKLWK